MSELPCAGGFRHQMDAQKARKRVVERRAKECRWNDAERTQRRPGSGRLPLHTARSCRSPASSQGTVFWVIRPLKGDKEPSPVSFMVLVFAAWPFAGKNWQLIADYGQSTAESLGLYVKYDWNNYGLQMRNDGITYKWQRMLKPYT